MSRAICNICGNEIDLTKINLAPELRESIICPNCGSISRDRMMIYGLQYGLATMIPISKMKTDKSLKVLETSGSRGHPPYLSKLFDYYNIWYDPLVLKSGYYDKRKHGDLQELNFDDNFFDIILCSDVFEHVRLPQKAFSEVFRVLKKGGILVLQVPFLGLDKHNVQFVEPVGDKDIFLSTPQYHDAHTLVYQLFGGLDLIPTLSCTGFHVNFIEKEISEYAISWQHVIICLKS
ncbi:MAG: class I SAM-dependent methyltransferase [Methanoregula sp.]